MAFRHWLESNDYRGLHEAPLYDLSVTYPEDIYGPNGARYYGHFGGDDAMDRGSIATLLDLGDFG